MLEELKTGVIFFFMLYYKVKNPWQSHIQVILLQIQV